MSFRRIVQYTFLEILRLALMGAALFLSSGKPGWWPAWAALSVIAGWMLATAILLVRYNPDLIAERIGPQEGSKRWDTTLMNALYMVSLLRYILAGLDQRFGWTGGFLQPVQFAGLLVCVLGYALFTWATAANPYFSRIVRIQEERGHIVSIGGPYRWVRHPGYVGAIAYELAVGVLFASWTALLAGMVSASLLILRTAMEDRTLLAELPGYKEYAHRVNRRLMPGLW